MLNHLFPRRRELMATQQQLFAAEAELRVAEVIVDTVQAVMVTDARRRIVRVNEAFTELMGYRADEVIGNTPWMFRSNHHDKGFYDEMAATIGRTGRWQGEIWDRRKSGEVFPKWMTISTVPDAKGDITHMVATYVDISERKQAQEKIHQLLFYDVLTGLPNRALLLERLALALADSARSACYGAVLLLDWDRLKGLNDSLGHPHGDLLLQQIGQRLRLGRRGSDTVARLAGDEFAVVLPGLDGDAQQAAAKAATLASQAQAALAANFRLGEADYQGTSSAGLALFRGESASADELLKQAEMAMYRAKSDGRNRLLFFDATLERTTAERARLARELRHGIAQGELVLHYQPQFTLRNGEHVCTGAEALVRWQHPQRGLLAPGLFIPLAEESELIVELGRWVLRAACAQLAAWRREPGLRELGIAVNVSAAQFLADGFVDQVRSLLADAGVAAGLLELELTESLLVGNTAIVIDTMRALEQHGVRLSLDDFGTGYSSLAYLKRLPLHQLKIDRSFVCDLERSGSDAAIARAIVELAKSLGLNVIAEGVETAAQARLLASMGCTDFQGFFFSRPLPSAEFEALQRRSCCAAA